MQRERGKRMPPPDLAFEHEGTQLAGYLAEPTSQPRAGLVVIQEWWGLTPDIKDIADRYSQEGYLSFAPDLYHGVVAEEPDDARKAVMEMDRDRAAQEIDAAIAWLKGEHGVAKVGIVGYCMGGGLTLATALRPGSGADAAHVYYGGGMPPADQIATIRIPVMGSYGSLDEGIPEEQVNTLRETLEKAGVSNDIKMYEGAEHAFFNDTRPAFHPAAAANSWTRSLQWWKSHLA
jgi:carboxymethylenebutenolidase